MRFDEIMPGAFTDSSQEREAQEYVARELLESLLITAVGSGELKLAGRSQKETDECVIEFMNAFRRRSENPEFKIEMRIDHTMYLLEKARAFAEVREYEPAVLFYATWAEHWLNSVILNALLQRKFDATEAQKIVRETSNQAKQGWLLQLLGLPPLRAEDLSALRKVAELRNRFVHYKWNTLDDGWKELTELEAAIRDIETAIEALQSYEVAISEDGLEAEVDAVIAFIDSLE